MSLGTRPTAPPIHWKQRCLACYKGPRRIQRFSHTTRNAFVPNPQWQQLTIRISRRQQTTVATSHAYCALNPDRRCHRNASATIASATAHRGYAHTDNVDPPPYENTSENIILLAPFVILHFISGITFLSLFVNLIMVPVPPFPTNIFLHPSLLPLLIHHSVHPLLPLFHSRLKTCLFHKSYLLHRFASSSRTALRTIARTISSELLGFLVFLVSFLCHALD